MSLRNEGSIRTGGMVAVFMSPVYRLCDALAMFCIFRYQACARSTLISRRMIEASSRFNVMVETKLRATATVLDVELDRLNSVFVRMHELPPDSPSFYPHSQWVRFGSALTVGVQSGNRTSRLTPRSDSIRDPRGSCFSSTHNTQQVFLGLVGHCVQPGNQNSRVVITVEDV